MIYFLFFLSMYNVHIVICWKGCKLKPIYILYTTKHLKPGTGEKCWYGKSIKVLNFERRKKKQIFANGIVFMFAEKQKGFILRFVKSVYMPILFNFCEKKVWSMTSYAKGYGIEAKFNSNVNEIQNILKKKNKLIIENRFSINQNLILFVLKTIHVA